MRLRVLVLVPLLAPPMIASAWGSARLADRAGQWAGALVARAAFMLPEPEREAPSVVEVAAGPVLEVVTEQVGVKIAPSRQQVPSKPRATAGGGVYVRAPLVLRIAQSGARPAGASIGADGVHPAGLALSGVGGLGVGLRDGDILTHVGGQPVRSLGGVIATVTAAYRGSAAAVSGQVWRGGEPFQVVVELPYPTR